MRVVSNTKRVSVQWVPEKAIQSLVDTAAQEIAKEALSNARDLASGAIPTSDLRRMGHPFSRRRPNNSVPKLPINRQTGQLMQSMQVIVRKTTGRWRIFFRVSHEHAWVLKPEGTSKMVPRGFVDALIARVNTAASAIIQRAFRKK